MENMIGSLSVASREDSVQFRKPTMYEQLPTPDSIRLLKLHGFEGEVLSVSMTIHQLSQKVPFKALSYTRGPPVRQIGESNPVSDIITHDILCNGFQYAIGQNLFDALSQLVHEENSGYIWADAICINQADLLERNAQVALMGQLYSDCTEVYIWLGKDESGISDVNWAIEELFPVLNRLCEEKGSEHIMTDMATFPDPRDNLGLTFDEYLYKLRRYFTFTYRRTWFRRAWTFQEYVNSNKSSVHCGSHTLKWDDMFSFEKHVGNTNCAHLRIAGDTNDTVDDMPGVNLYVVMATNLRYWTKSSSELTKLTDVGMPHAMAETFGAENEEEMASVFYGAFMFNNPYQICSDVRDHIYSRFGILRSCFPGKQSDMYLPDYTLTAREVYYQTAKNIIENSPVLIIIGKLTEARQVPDLPSWVPDYGDELQYITPWEPKFDVLNYCSNETPLSPRHTVHGDILRAYGFYCDIISVAEPESSSDHALFLLDIMNFCHDLTGESLTGHDPLETYWRTRIFNDTSNSSPEELRRSFRSYLMYMIFIIFVGDKDIDEPPTETEAEDETFIQDLHGKYISIWNTKFAHETLPSLSNLKQMTKVIRQMRTPGEGQVEGMENFLSMIGTLTSEAVPWQSLTNRRSTNRMLFKTERGLLGLYESIGQKGDEIWCLTTARVPFVLRPLENGQRQIIDQAYVHGIMNGEVLDEKWGLRDKIGPVDIV